MSKITQVFLIISLFLGIGLVPMKAYAAESSTCDEGPIQDVQIFFRGNWHTRPDSRLDNLPHVSFDGTAVGPFRVRATLIDASVVKVTMHFQFGDDSLWKEYSLDIDGMTAKGKILPMINEIAPGDHIVHFYLEGYDQDDNLVWIDEIPYTCPPDEEYTQGDPYNFRMSVRR